MNTLELPRYITELGWYPGRVAVTTATPIDTAPPAETSESYDSGVYDEDSYG